MGGGLRIVRNGERELKHQTSSFNIQRSSKHQTPSANKTPHSKRQRFTNHFMSTSRLITFSLCLNLVLAGVLIYAHCRSPAMGQPAFASKEITNRSPRLDARRSTLDTSAAGAPAAAAVVDEPFWWAQSESEDYRVYVANLRAI